VLEVGREGQLEKMKKCYMESSRKGTSWVL